HEHAKGFGGKSLLQEANQRVEPESSSNPSHLGADDVPGKDSEGGIDQNVKSRTPPPRIRPSWRPQKGEGAKNGSTHQKPGDQKAQVSIGYGKLIQGAPPSPPGHDADGEGQDQVAAHDDQCKLPGRHPYPSLSSLSGSRR